MRQGITDEQCRLLASWLGAFNVVRDYSWPLQDITVLHVVALPGEEFIVKNSDPIGHNIQARPKYDGGFNRTLAANTKASFKLSSAEDQPVPVASAIHPHMQGYLMACENPYFAVTDKSGRFHIANLPAGGPLEFQVWHERVPKGLNVKDVKQSRLTIQLEADEMKDLGDIVIKPEMVR